LLKEKKIPEGLFSSKSKKFSRFKLLSLWFGHYKKTENEKTFKTFILQSVEYIVNAFL
jgi:hypothetical protein